jgi:ergothioneine biosynthesis protein EgtB
MASALLDQLLRVRDETESLCAELSAEDQQLQSMPDCSPTKWHRGHTTWFFDTMVLGAVAGGAIRPDFAPLFNSYYESLGQRHPRPQRGLLSRPTSAEVGEYRREVDAALAALEPALAAASDDSLRALLELGIAHEQQHQELILTDILHAFAANPLRPAVRPVGRPARVPGPTLPLRFIPHAGGIVEIGASPAAGFSFDNEGPRHRVFLEPFALANRPVTIGEWRVFADEGGYRTPSLWLSEGWDWVRSQGIEAPLYTRYEDGAVTVFTLDGDQEAHADEPVRHVSYYEADAIARFMEARLPTEAEWEACASDRPVSGNFRESGALGPLGSAGAEGEFVALFGDVWEWTSSGYGPYPGYRPAPGAVGEYNGKFMVSQLVLRGGSCLSPASHLRASYRNFWHPHIRFQMTGVRLARDPAR